MPRANDRLTRLLQALGSLQVALACLVLLMLLTTACTLEQGSLGIFPAVDKYFRSAFLYRQVAGWPLPWFPAGGAVGAALLVNLGASMASRFQWTWRKAGLWLSHLGLVTLVLGEFVTGMLAVETRMPIFEGETVNYTESPRLDELYVVELSQPDVETVYAVPLSMARPGRELSHAGWPFTLAVRETHRNARLGPRPEASGLPPSLADQGLGKDLVLRADPPAGDEGRDQAAAFVAVREGGRELGTWLLASALGREQVFSAGGRDFAFGLRPARRMLPFSLTLVDFRHDLYPGTEIPRNFSSLVRLVNAQTGEERDVLIWMNNPLRYLGRTFYQASFGQADTLSILQVVENPGWLLPYVSFVMMAAGLLLHFILALLAFKPAAPKARDAALPRDSARSAAAAAAVALLVLAALPARAKDPAGLADFARLPVLHNGRIKPLDSVARSSLLVLHGKQTLSHEGRRLSAAEWLLELSARPREADRMKVFRIDDPDLLGLLGQRGGDGRVYAFEVLTPRLAELDAQAQRAAALDPRQRTRFERAALELREKAELYLRLRNTLAPEDTQGLTAELAALEAAMAEGKAGVPRLAAILERFRGAADAAYYRPLPPPPGAAPEAWKTPGEGILEPMLSRAPLAAELKGYAAVLDAWRAGDKAGFASGAAALRSLYGDGRPRESAQAARELAFNRLAPFGKGMALYILAFVLACASWLTGSERLRRAAVWSLGTAFLLHSAGVLGRMVIQGRPPVTNLYSSAVFVGWGAVLLALGLEWAHRRGLAAAMGAAVGFCTLLVAHHLAMSGDTLEMMQAVLDSNFWLATHVVTITLGYSAAFLAGTLATAWIVGASAGRLGRETARSLAQMTYGTVCFALVLSFVGTVLGGIWADQSWGRFWGWDPKENGALLLVLWMVVILHARWGGFVRERGIMVMAVFGNVVTALAWFGVNMLGVGLHSYGFMDKAAAWLAAFIVLQLAVMAAGARAPVPEEA
ncbi:MAG: cytochrome c biogenesis protein CcsA [Elusimicrobia bacterium]|nr:cytochrome c biogenesis protein CcsA [Elusimicrobiota bacterium]